MKRFLSVLVLALVPLGAQAGTLKHDVISPNVTVDCEDCSGAGTVLKVGSEVLVLTAGHVVQNSLPREVEVSGFGKVRKPAKPIHIVRKIGDRTEKQPAEVVAFSPPDEQGGRDLALLRPMIQDSKEKETFHLVPAIFDPKPSLEEGEDVWFIGFGGGLANNLQKTIVNQVGYQETRWPGLHRFTVLNGGGWYGHSGGGAYVKRGKEYHLIGVVVLLQNPENPKSPTQAVAPAVIAQFLSEYQKKDGPKVGPSDEMPRSTP